MGVRLRPVSERPSSALGTSIPGGKAGTGALGLALGPWLGNTAAGPGGSSEVLELSPQVLASRPGKGLGATFDAAPGASPRRFGGVCSRGRLSGSGALAF